MKFISEQKYKLGQTLKVKLYRSGRREVKCKSCGGTGGILIKKKWFTCSDCKGYGHKTHDVKVPYTTTVTLQKICMQEYNDWDNKYKTKQKLFEHTYSFSGYNSGRDLVYTEKELEKLLVK